ncbi:MAG TPA: hypothetical protein VGB50_04675 [Flavobacterium sp.]|jgi:hypothetical protein
MAHEDNKLRNEDDVNEGHIDYSRSNSNKEYHNLKERYQHITPDRLDGDVENRNFDTSMENTGDEYSNTKTGNNVSAMDRRENFTDENYGATAARSAKDILGNKNNNDDQ